MGLGPHLSVSLLSSYSFHIIILAIIIAIIVIIIAFVIIVIMVIAIVILLIEKGGGVNWSRCCCIIEPISLVAEPKAISWSNTLLFHRHHQNAVFTFERFQIQIESKALCSTNPFE